MAARRIPRVSFALLTLMGSSHCAFAQEKEIGSLSLEELVLVKVQTAALHEQSIESAPAAISVITAQEIQNYGYRTLAEVLNHVRGFYVTYDYTYHNAGVAGFSVPGDWSTRLLVLLDGHGLADNIFGSANYFGEDSVIDMNLVERIEIVRGPSSALYGSNGILATINIITTKASRKNENSVRVETGTSGQRKVSVTQSINFAKQYSLLISGTAFNNSGQHDLYVPQLDTTGINNGHAIDMDGEKGYRFFADLTMGRWQIIAAGVSRQKIQPVSWADTVFNDRGTRATDQRGFLDALYTREFDSKHVLRWRTSYDSVRYKGDYRYPLAGDQIQVNKEFDAGDWVGSQLTWRFPLLRGALTAGSEVKVDLRALQSVADIQPVFQQNLLVNERDAYAAGFLQQEWGIGRRWSFDFGTRYDWSKYRSSSVSPRAAIVFQASARTSLKLIYGRGFRNPNANELFFDDDKQNEGNLALRPEEADNVEIALERRLRKSWIVNVSGYEMRDRRVIVPQILDTGLQQFVNAALFRGSGLGIELTGKPASFLEIDASFQKQKAFLNGNTPANSPGNIGKLRALVPLRGKRILLSAGLLYQSERTSLNGTLLPAVYLSEATVVWKAPHNAVELQFGVRNLTNSHYVDPIGLTSTVDTIEQPGRSFFLTLTSHANLPEEHLRKRTGLDYPAKTE